MKHAKTAVNGNISACKTPTSTRNKLIILTTISLCTFSTPASSATFEWVNGKVTSFTAQLPMFTVAIVNNKVVRFCDPSSGSDYVVNSDNLHYDMLKTSFLGKKKVQVGVQNFGSDPQSGTTKLCIDRVILTN